MRLLTLISRMVATWWSQAISNTASPSKLKYVDVCKYHPRREQFPINSTRITAASWCSPSFSRPSLNSRQRWFLLFFKCFSANLIPKAHDLDAIRAIDICHYLVLNMSHHTLLVESGHHAPRFKGSNYTCESGELVSDLRINWACLWSWRCQLSRCEDSRRELGFPHWGRYPRELVPPDRQLQ